MASPSAQPFPTVSITEVDGVPVLWSEAITNPTFALQFRVGRASERPADGGITHIVEHLVMATLGDPRYEHNAFVDDTRTVFFASGLPSEVVGFAGAIGAALDALPIDRLDRERQVLTREADGRGQGATEVHAQFRFGFAGHGLVGTPEFGLVRSGAEDVQAWATERFQRADAVAFLTAAPPADLRLPLRDGTPHDVPAVTPEPTVRWPSHVRTGSGNGVGLGSLVRRRLGAASFVAILQRRLRGRLRLEHGLMYDVVADYTPLDAEWATALVGGDCDDAHVQQVTDIALEELDRLVRGEVSQGEIDEETEDYRRSMLDPTSLAGILDSMAFDRLVGMPWRSLEDRFEEQRTTTPADLAERATEARQSLLLLADVDRHPDDLIPYPADAESAVDGREIKPVLSMFGLGFKQRMIVGPEGVSIRHKDGTATVRFADCVALEDPGKDGIVLWARDTTRLWIPVDFWRGGEAVIDEIRAAVPADIVVRGTFSHDYVDG